MIPINLFNVKLKVVVKKSEDAASLYLLGPNSSKAPRLEEAETKHGEKDEQWSNPPARVANLSPQNSSE